MSSERDPLQFERPLSAVRTRAAEPDRPATVEQMQAAELSARLRRREDELSRREDELDRRRRELADKEQAFDERLAELGRLIGSVNQRKAALLESNE